MKTIIQTALEWFHCSGPQTRERLNGLVAHYSESYGLSPETLVGLQQDAWNRHTDSLRYLGKEEEK